MPIGPAPAARRTVPRSLRLLAAAGLIGGVVVGGYGGHRWTTGRAQRATAAAWQRFDEAVRTADAGGMAAALDAVLAADPGEPTAVARKRTLATGDAAADDRPMIAYTLRQALRGDDLPGAAREADKYLRHQPKDWLAHCAKASAALAHGDRAAAVAGVEALPDPGEEGANVEAGGLLVAFRLFRALDRDTARLRGFVQARVCPALKSATVQGLGAADKLALVACYLEGFEPPSARPQPTPLLLAWTPVAALMDAAAESEPHLARAGGLGVGLNAAVVAFRATDQMTAEQAADFTREVNARSRRCFTKLCDANPKAAEAYRGLAVLLAGDGQYAEARAEVVRGLQACENDPGLAAIFGRMLQLEGRPLEAYSALRAMADREPHKAAWWGLAVTAAVAANRADLALADCAAMRHAMPGNAWAARAEAGLWLDAGDAARAAALLRPLGAADLAKDADAARLYARSLSAAGRPAELPAFLADAERVAHDRDDPAPLAGAMRGLLEAKPDAAGASRVAAECQRFAGRWPDADDFYRLRAEALYRVAEAAAPEWDGATVAAAVQAVDRFRARHPGDRAAAVMLVTLRLHAGPDRTGNAAHAARDAGPLRDAEADPLATADELEALGTVYRVNGKWADAVRVLERLSRSAAVRPGAAVQLALTYFAQRKFPEARAALALAQTCPRSPQEQADYVAAVRQLDQETP